MRGVRSQSTALFTGVVLADSLIAMSGARLSELRDSILATSDRLRLSGGAAASLWTFFCTGSRHMDEAGRALAQLGPAVPVVDSARRPPRR
ncbi:MAG TPA: hypothetical protein VLE53_10420 [Gemmatimonadaceae bacterium]|nr:hypothetical protein [Gemmatimonadaceae bacterium]